MVLNIITHQGMQIKTTVGHHFILIKIFIIKK